MERAVNKSTRERAYALAADVGGTKTFIALFDRSSGVKPLVLRSYLNREFSSIEELIEDYLEESGHRRVTSACLEQILQL